MRRPSSRSYSGVVRPSTMPKIQTNAATLMNSGTVTKNPAMKLRRSHCIVVHTHPAPSAASSADPTTMRYHANGAKPDAPDEAQERLDDEQPTRRTPSRTRPRSPAPRSASRWRRTSSSSCANAAAIVGIARKNENSAAAGRSRPISHAADDRRARPRDARNRAPASGTTPIAERARRPAVSSTS